jgi:hypothetical protein
MELPETDFSTSPGRRTGRGYHRRPGSRDRGNGQAFGRIGLGAAAAEDGASSPGRARHGAG